MMKPTQNGRLLAYLERHADGITTLEASDQLRICRLSERIRELERHDVLIERDDEHTAGGARIVRYKLQRIPYG